MKKHRLVWIGLVMALSVMLSACGKDETVELALPPQPPAVEENAPVTSEPSEEVQQPEQEEPQEPQDAFSFADVADLEFYFSSGAGAWSTVLYIHEDGSFDGEYQDRDMGDLDEARYPNGTCYYNAFTGQFTQPEKVNEYTYRMRMTEMNHLRDFGEEIREETRWIYTEAYGMYGAEVVYLYLPGAPLAELPEEYLGWVGYYDLTQTEETDLPFYGLYNEAQGNGFSGYPAPNLAEMLRAGLAEAELLAEEVEQNLEAAMTQMEMNQAAGELYQVWDDMLNLTWAYLKKELSQEAMQQLTTEQLAWITEKEAAATAAGAAYEGGSMQSMIINLKAAEWTRQRVYKLAEYLK